MVDKDEYRRRIILTASTIFSHYGFRKTTMDEISRALKKGKSSIYYYFGSKEEIFEAVVLHEANQLRARLTKAIKEVESPPDKLRNYIYVRMKEFAKLSNYYNAVFDKNLDHFEFIEKIRSRYVREELAILRLLVNIRLSRFTNPCLGQPVCYLTWGKTDDGGFVQVVKYLAIQTVWIDRQTFEITLTE